MNIQNQIIQDITAESLRKKAYQVQLERQQSKDIQTINSILNRLNAVAERGETQIVVKGHEMNDYIRDYLVTTGGFAVEEHIQQELLDEIFGFNNKIEWRISF